MIGLVVLDKYCPLKTFKVLTVASCFTDVHPSFTGNRAKETSKLVFGTQKNLTDIHRI